MSVTAEDFLRFASELLAKPIQTEIDHRNAAARTYYAVMHLVRSELGINPTLGSHGGIGPPADRLDPANVRAQSGEPTATVRDRRADPARNHRSRMPSSLSTGSTLAD